MEITKEQLINHLGNMSVMEVSKLVRDLEEEWGVSSTPQIAQTTQGLNPDPVVEQTEFDVVLESFGEKKINVIKALRAELPGLGLKEAKSLVESAPALVKESVSKEEADNLHKVLTEAGGEATVK